ncbi:MAG TPA: hypothetical protein ENI23_17475 [bacterium]|nr:hypothetical protein [bacterium]
MKNKSTHLPDYTNVLPEELYSMDVTFAAFILPRLKAFKEHCLPGPEGPEKEEFKTKLDKMILAFDKIAADDVCPRIRAGVDIDQEIEEGLNLFKEHLFNLWC